MKKFSLILLIGVFLIPALSIHTQAQEKTKKPKPSKKITSLPLVLLWEICN